MSQISRVISKYASTFCCNASKSTHQYEYTFVKYKRTYTRWEREAGSAIKAGFNDGAVVILLKLKLKLQVPQAERSNELLGHASWCRRATTLCASSAKLRQCQYAQILLGTTLTSLAHTSGDDEACGVSPAFFAVAVVVVVHALCEELKLCVR